MLCVFGLWPGPTEGQLVLRALAPPQERSASGRWGTGVEAAGAAQRMMLRVRQSEDGTVAGSVQIAGSPLLRNGTLEGKIRGGFVTGVVKDESGEIAATFTGRVNPDGTMSGTYTDRTGEVGSWQWPDSPESPPVE